MRNSYTTYLREEKSLSSGARASKRKKWYLADYLSFLRDFVGQHRKSVSNITIEEDLEETQSLEDSVNEAEESFTSPLNYELFNSDPSTILSTANSRVLPRKVQKRKSLEALTEPMINFLESRTEQNQSINQSGPVVTATGKFFESLIPDVEKLDAKREHLFKSQLLEILYGFLDQQESE